MAWDDTNHDDIYRPEDKKPRRALDDVKPTEVINIPPRKDAAPVPVVVPVLNESTEEAVYELAKHLADEKRAQNTADFQNRVVRVLLSMERRMRDVTAARQAQEKRDTMFIWIFSIVIILSVAAGVFFFVTEVG